MRVAKTLRTEHGFQGYIHLKTIPEASQELIDEAGKWADRLSINVELPTQKALDDLAPEKQLVTIKRSMNRIADRIEEATQTAGQRKGPVRPTRYFAVPTEYADDRRCRSIHRLTILATALYSTTGQRLPRVYYSASAPIIRIQLLPPSSLHRSCARTSLSATGWCFLWFPGQAS